MAVGFCVGVDGVAVGVGVDGDVAVRAWVLMWLMVFVLVLV